MPESLQEAIYLRLAKELLLPYEKPDSGEIELPEAVKNYQKIMKEGEIARGPWRRSRRGHKRQLEVLIRSGTEDDAEELLVFVPRIDSETEWYYGASGALGAWNPEGFA